MSWRLILVFTLTVIIYAVNILAYAARLAGIRTRRPAQTSSLYNLLALSARTAHALQATLLAGLVDRAASVDTVGQLTTTLRWVLLGAAGGIVIGAGLIPSFARLLARGVDSFAARGSIPRVVLHGLSVDGMPQVWSQLKRPRAGAVRYAQKNRPGRRWIAITLIVAALNAVAAPAAQIASVVAVGGTRTSLSLPAFLTGIGSILMVLLVDPVTARVMDQALRGERPEADVTVFTVWQVAAQLMGTLAAQLALAPAAQALAALARWLV